MKFSLEKPVKLIMLGAGGTGGYVAPHLYRLLHTLERPVKVIIVDGDIVEEKNLIRQNFVASDIGRNKAQVLAERYASAFGMEAYYIPDFIECGSKLFELTRPDTHLSSPNSYQQRPEDTGARSAFSPEAKIMSSSSHVILIGAVDNNRSRQLCHQVFNKADDIIYLDSGNGEYTGQVVCGIRRKGWTYYEPIGDAYPDILIDNDKFPTELSCAEAAMSAPQSIVANVMAATAVVSYIYNILVLGSIEARSVTFSTKSVNLKPTIKHIRKAA